LEEGYVMVNDWKNINRREFLRRSGTAAAAMTMGMAGGAGCRGKSSNKRRGAKAQKVIVLGVDGMDPRLAERMMDSGQLPHFDMLRKSGGYRRLGTSTPPQSPVAWANFINGAGPGSHGIFDFIHRHPEQQCAPFFSAAETLSGSGYWEVGNHKLQLDFWPFNHKPAATLLRREGVPFWDYLDAAGINSTFYNLPSNYPASPSRHGNHRCLSGMGTPDMLGTYGTYQHFSEDGPLKPKDEGGGRRCMLFFENAKAQGQLIGPPNSFLKQPEPATIDFSVYSDAAAQAAVIEIQGQKIVLKKSEWSRWIKLDFEMSLPAAMPNEHISGICRFYLQEVTPNFRLYVTPINTDPSDPAINITEPPEFATEISKKLGLFYTTGFQEDHKALSNGVFGDSEFIGQAGIVLQERLNLLEYAMANYDDGLLFFYFSSTDLQSHMLWWDSEDEHPCRSATEAVKCFEHIKDVYRKMDEVLGRLLEKYGKDATIMVLSDHGFANFKRQFNLNAWLLEKGYIAPNGATSVLSDTDWSSTKAYGLGINGLYLNLQGREKNGIVAPGREREELLAKLVSELEQVADDNGRKVIHKVHRSDKEYTGGATRLAPDLIIGYSRDYRASWSTCLGDMTGPVLYDNDSAWSADHCSDPAEVPGVLFCNRAVAAAEASLIDLAPSILAGYGLKKPDSMTGKDVFG